VDELRGDVDRKQAFHRFSGEWTGKNIASDDEAVCFGLPNFFEHSLKRRQVRMNVVNSSDAHSPCSMQARQCNEDHKRTAAFLFMDPQRA
jgi:hypothetical protein